MSLNIHKMTSFEKKKFVFCKLDITKMRIFASEYKNTVNANGRLDNYIL